MKKHLEMAGVGGFVLLMICFAGVALGDVSGDADGVSRGSGQWWHGMVELFTGVANDNVGRAMLIVNGAVALILFLVVIAVVRSNRKQKKAIFGSKHEVDEAMRQLASDRLAAMNEINHAIDKVQKKCREAVDETVGAVEQMKDDSKESVVQAKAAIKGVRLAWSKIQDWEKASQRKFGEIDEKVAGKLDEIETAAASATKASVMEIGDKADWERRLMKMWKYAIEMTAKKEHAKACEVLEQASALWARINKEYPGTHEAFNNWGGVLLEQARTAAGDEREKLLDEAIDKLMVSESVKRGGGAYNLGCAYAVMDNYEQSKKWLEVGGEAETLETRDHAMADEDLRAVWREEWFRKLEWK